MLRVALTGGIATGKSHVARRIAAAGIPVIDADVLAREVVAPGTPGHAAVAARFGSQMLLPSGQVDRARLGKLVFADAGARRDLEGIIHPAVRQAIDAFFIAQPSSTAFAVADIPLLFETGRQGEFDVVIVVACDRARQIERIQQRDGLSREEAVRRVAAQLPIEGKVAQADYVIRTDGTLADTDAQVDAVLDSMRS